MTILKFPIAAPAVEPVDSPVSTDNDRAASVVWARLERSLRLRAQAMLPAPDDQDDLVQEAHVELWKLDASRFDPRDIDDMRYVRRMLVNHMWKVSGIPRGAVPVRGVPSAEDDTVLTPQQAHALMAAAGGSNTRPSLDDTDRQGRRQHLRAV